MTDRVEVLALIGPAGTGKSHRATVVAHEHGVDAIIDDGLLVQGSRIVAGRSAKAEPTKMAAVRRAVFSDPAHRREVRKALDGIGAARVLVLGTSAKMVERIVSSLALPMPARWIRIEEIASPEEIRQARNIRRRQGKHVVPAPTLEVKRSFSGVLVDPLRFFYRSKRIRRDLIIEKSVVRPTFSSLGRFFLSESAVADIARYVAGTVDGIDEVLRVAVQSGAGGVSIQVEVSVHFGILIPAALRRAQAKIKEQVESMTALNVNLVHLEARRFADMKSRKGESP